MTRYKAIAAEAGKMIREVVALFPHEQQPEMSVKLGRIFNYGIRVSPRGVHRTVRREAVTEALRGLPVSVSMTTVQDGLRTFNALSLIPFGGSAEIERDED